MKKIHYNKLIRDRIPQKIARSGGSFRVRALRATEFEQELLKKVGEEASALPIVKGRQELLDELADVLAVIDEIKRVKKISAREIAAAQKGNFKKKGGFKKRLYLYWSEDTGYRTNERKGS
ncbi:MAG: nucleoside triphosphate pyrophosphohydrolase [Candidatus Komeilibacteria bacterium]|nr:nucleoside triphosphate pyrophosphohydrolase [Candidatus Komeilibacteria bacterium]